MPTKRYQEQGEHIIGRPRESGVLEPVRDRMGQCSSLQVCLEFLEVFGFCGPLSEGFGEL